MSSTVLKSKTTNNWGLVELRQEGKYYCIYINDEYKKAVQIFLI